MRRDELTLDEKSIVLLREIFISTYDLGDGVTIIKFRANHHQYRKLIDTLLEARFIDDRNGKYVVRLTALGEIESGTPQVQDLLSWCERLFTYLRQAYLNDPGGNVNITKLLDETGLSIRHTAACLPFLAESSILGGWITDITAKDAYVQPAERILDYESFAQIIDERREWAFQAATRTQTTVPPISTPFSFPSYWGAGDAEKLSYLLHPKIIEHALPKFQDGHLRNAVLDSIIAVFDLIRQKTGLNEDGDELIGKVFSLGKPYLILSEIESESGKNDQKGFMQIFKGIYQGVRNPKAHSLTSDLTEIAAAQYLVLASLLARRVEEARLIEQDEIN